MRKFLSLVFIVISLIACDNSSSVYNNTKKYPSEIKLYQSKYKKYEGRVIHHIDHEFPSRDLTIYFTDGGYLKINAHKYNLRLTESAR